MLLIESLRNGLNISSLNNATLIKMTLKLKVIKYFLCIDSKFTILKYIDGLLTDNWEIDDVHLDLHVHEVFINLHSILVSEKHNQL